MSLPTHTEPKVIRYHVCLDRAQQRTACGMDGNWASETQRVIPLGASFEEVTCERCRAVLRGDGLLP